MWIVPIMMMLAIGCLTVGATLGYYVPMYPYIMFSFGCLGWMIAILEAMVAAPLIALGLTHPEGHDFLGKAEQAIMLLLGIFLRPVLMVVGLIGRMPAQTSQGHVQLQTLYVGIPIMSRRALIRVFGSTHPNPAVG